jgi:hypothetical protein
MGQLVSYIILFEYLLATHCIFVSENDILIFSSDLGPKKAKASDKVICYFFLLLTYLTFLNDLVWSLRFPDLTLFADSFADSVRRRCSVLQWNPDIATQLVVASDEDGSPSLRVTNFADDISFV